MVPRTLPRRYAPLTQGACDPGAQASRPGRKASMKTLEKVSDFVGKYMALIVIAMAALSLFAPGTVSWIKTSWVNTLLGIVMFGMGLTLKPHDFAVVFQRPKDVVIGAVLQYTIMPLLAFALCHLFRLPAELAIGVILVGTCPGGTSSNVMTYLSHGDVALSVSMTAVSTLLSPLLTPALTLLYAGRTVDVNFLSMMWSVVKVVLLPIVLGFVVNGLCQQCPHHDKRSFDPRCCHLPQPFRLCPWLWLCKALKA